MDLFEIAGLPLHPLIVHAVVVLIPLTALALVLGALFPPVRRRLGIVTPVAALIVAALVPVTILAGESLMEEVGPIPQVLQHEALGRMLPPWTISLFLVAAAQWSWYRFGARPAQARTAEGTAVQGPPARADRIAAAVFAVLSLVVAAGSTIMVVLIGESGARAVWG
ncbi:DUF2231 domain-containing protein [Microbacterium sp. SD291]|uniref:DUF2231 domain-containing protein n=1 Tax=Microbacterium sp. SD291 TaxID=2782007 RepID=UPI001A96744D|nr:DUF2231 domain-containing protein [Microbacterium sp. SD291]MBO0979296.1 hypothetical protein [Microbacterium sp. SD291]